MPSFNIVVDHDSTKCDVVDRLKGFSDKVRSDLPADVSLVDEQWDDDGNLAFALQAMGFRVSGNMVTCEQHVTVTGKLPFAALPFRGAVENMVSSKIRELLENS